MHGHGCEIDTQTCGVSMVHQALLQSVELPTQNVVRHKYFKDLQWITEIYSFAIQQSPIVEMPQKESSFVSIQHTRKAK